MTERTVRVQEYFFWSPILGEDAIRFSVYDERGNEYWSIVPLVSPGKKLREAREERAIRIMEVMDSGRDPGEVT